MTKQSIKEGIIARVDNLAKNMWWAIPENKRFGIVERKVEVTQSPWYKPDAPDYCVKFFYGENLMECENGLTLDATIKSVYCWYNNSGFLKGRPMALEMTDIEN